LGASEPFPPFFLPLLAMFSSSVVSPAALAKGKEFVYRHPVGTGAFRVASWTPGQEIVLDANPTWWGGRPALAHVVLKVDTNVRGWLPRLETGEAQAMDSVATEDVARIEKDPKLRL